MTHALWAQAYINLTLTKEYFEVKWRSIAGNSPIWNQRINHLRHQLFYMLILLELLFKFFPGHFCYFNQAKFSFELKKSPWSKRKLMNGKMPRKAIIISMWAKSKITWNQEVPFFELIIMHKNHIPPSPRTLSWKSLFTHLTTITEGYLSRFQANYFWS